MRAFIFLSLVLIAIVQVSAQEKTPLQVPEVVNNTFLKQYPQVAEVKWKEKKEEYMAEFKVGKMDHELWLTKAGVIAKHTYEINTTNYLPQSRILLQQIFCPV